MRRMAYRLHRPFFGHTRRSHTLMIRSTLCGVWLFFFVMFAVGCGQREGNTDRSQTSSGYYGLNVVDYTIQCNA
jgi:hypothetical protein